MSDVSFLSSLNDRLDRKRCAVMVIDMQNDFCAEGGYVEAVVGRSTAACREMVPSLSAFLTTARAAGVPVVWVRAVYDHDKLPVGMLAKQRANGDAVCCAQGSSGVGFFGVAPEAGEPVFDKHSYSAFTNDDLVPWLSRQGVESIVFTGVQTNVCVESSLREAVCRGFYAAIASDCVASHAPPLHEATLNNVRALFGDVLAAGEIAEIWGVQSREAQPG